MIWKSPCWINKQIYIKDSLKPQYAAIIWQLVPCTQQNFFARTTQTNFSLPFMEVFKDHSVKKWQTTLPPLLHRLPPAHLLPLRLVLLYRLWHWKRMRKKNAHLLVECFPLLHSCAVVPFASLVTFPTWFYLTNWLNWLMIACVLPTFNKSLSYPSR